MNPRLPFLALVGLAVGGALLASEGRGRDEPASAGGDGPTIESPGSTWFCAGGSAAGAPGEGFADHTVVVTAGPEPLTGRLTVVAGDHAPAPPTAGDPAATTTTDGDGTTTTAHDEAGDDDAEGTATTDGAGDDGVDGDGSGDDGAGDDGTTTTSTTTPAGTASTVAASATAGAGDRAAAPIRERTFDLAAGQQARFRLADVVRAPLAAAVVEVDHPPPATTEPWAPAPTTAPAEPGLPVATVEHEVTGPEGTDTAPCADHSASTWHFAWGATTRDARERLVLFNPFPNDVAVDAVFSTDRGVREPRRWQGLTVPARSVVAVDVGEDVTRRGHVAATLHVRGGRLVVDRVQAFDGQLGSAGVSVAAGVAEPATGWLFADGVVEPGHATRIVLYNPGDEVAEVDVVVGIDPGAIAPDPGADDLTDLTDGAGGRLRPAPFGMTVRPGRYEVLDLGEQSRVPKGVVHSVAVRSTNGVPVVAERVVGTPDPAAGPRFDGRPPLRITPDSPSPAP